MATTYDECAREVLEVVPLVMRAIRTQVRSHRRLDLSVPQLRTLAFLSHHEGSSLSEVAEHIGLTLPSMSKLIDGLVARQLVTRETCLADRRRIRLALTGSGGTVLQSAHNLTQAYLSQHLAQLPPAACETIVRAMQTLRPVFTPHHELEMKPEP